MVPLALGSGTMPQGPDGLLGYPPGELVVGGVLAPGYPGGTIIGT